MALAKSPRDVFVARGFKQSDFQPELLHFASVLSDVQRRFNSSLNANWFYLATRCIINFLRRFSSFKFNF